MLILEGWWGKLCSSRHGVATLRSGTLIPLWDRSTVDDAHIGCPAPIALKKVSVSCFRTEHRRPYIESAVRLGVQEFDPEIKDQQCISKSDGKGLGGEPAGGGVAMQHSWRVIEK